MRSIKTGIVGIAAAVLVLGFGGITVAQAQHLGAKVVNAQNGTGPDVVVLAGNGTGPDAPAA